MATYDRSQETAGARSAADSRLPRHLRLDWSALCGGTLLGWGVLLLLSMVGMIAGLSVIDPFTARPAASNGGAAIWGAAAAIVSSVVGAFAVVRLAGDRRRSESLMHGAVSWGMSMAAASLIALFASGLPAFGRAPARSSSLHRGQRGQIVSLVGATGGGAMAVFATAGAALALVGSLLGALAAASRESGLPFSDEFRLRRRKMNGHHQEPSIIEPESGRDETTILPPSR